MKNKSLRRKIFSSFLVILGFVIGFLLGKSNKSHLVDAAAKKVKTTVTESVAGTFNLDARKLVLMENPSLIKRIMKGGSFGNENFSVVAAQNMFGKNEKAIKDIIKKTEVVKITDQVWNVRLPIVNCAFIETTEGIVLIDTGMKPAGPAILQAIRSVSSKPIHTIIYTHGHVDHSYGTWALTEAGENPQIIAHENLPKRTDRYIRLSGSIAKYMSQPHDQLPKDSIDYIWPTKTFRDQLDIEVGKVRIHLKHFEGETDDQLFVWLPEQKIVFAADYYQGFLPNAGNGKRIQRNIPEWIKALREMADLNPEIMLPSHGKPVVGNDAILEALTIHADVLEHIHDYAVNALNQSIRKDLIVERFEMPERFADHPLLEVLYVTGKDICKMVIRQYTGWWDDIPSHWSPASLEDQSQSIVELSGGIDQMIAHIKALIPKDLAMASHFVDWAYFADPDNPEIQDLVMEIYKKRILDERSVTQEMLVYLDHMADVRAKQ